MCNVDVIFRYFLSVVDSLLHNKISTESMYCMYVFIYLVRNLDNNDIKNRIYKWSDMKENMK